MKVCVVVINSVWYDPRVRKQIVEYIRDGAQTSCVGYRCSRYDPEKVAQVPCPVDVVVPDPRYHGKQRSLIKKILREFKKIADLRDAVIAQAPDVIHANDLDTLMSCCLAAKKLGCKVVYDSHEIGLENQYLKGIHKKFYAWVERTYVKKADQMVCVSHAAAEHFRSTYGVEKLMVVTNCSLMSERVAEQPPKNEGFEVLNHGQYYAGRGYDIMVEAVPYLKDHPQIRVAMRGFGKLEPELRARAAELGEDQVRFYPKVLVQELISEAARSHVGVAITEDICLNFRLSVSNKLFEYASAGIPVIMSDIPEHRYLNDKYHFGIILPENTPKAFAEAVIRLYTDEALYHSCVEGAERLTREVNWETEFGRLLQVERSWIHGTK
ncbi:MAG: glycosyltransferase [Oscillospiraceae bacterium]|nr:glycosyltransferase [Oscillospiraceae bacterium]